MHHKRHFPSRDNWVEVSWRSIECLLLVFFCGDLNNVNIEDIVRLKECAVRVDAFQDFAIDHLAKITLVAKFNEFA